MERVRCFYIAADILRMNRQRIILACAYLFPAGSKNHLRARSEKISIQKQGRQKITSYGLMCVLGLILFPFISNAQFVGGNIGSNQCINSGATPAGFTSIDPASGGFFAPTYQWQRSTDNFATAPFDIPLATGATYTETGTLTVTTYYRRKANDLILGDAFSNTITVGIKPTFTPVVPPLPVICQGVTSFPVNYNTGNFPDQYSIVWNAAASAAGLADVNASFASNNLTAFSGSFNVTVPSNITPGTYFGSLSVRVSATGCTSTPQAAPVEIRPLPTALISGATVVCQNGAAPSVTFTGGNATSPYTFSYRINGGAIQTTPASTGNTIAITAPTSTAGNFVYSLESVQESSSTTCSATASGSTTIVVNPLPFATITGNNTVCQNSASPSVTFTGSGGTAPYTFTYNLNGGSNQTITTTSGNSIALPVSTTTAGSFAYTLVSVQDASATNCTNSASGTATINVTQEPSATLSGTTAVCQNATAPSITFTGSNGIAPYIFTYRINGVTNQVTTSSGNSVTVAAPTGTTGTFVYDLVSVQESGPNSCSKTIGGSATVTVNPLPTATISGTTNVCQNAAASAVTFTGSNGTAPYTFVYKINGGPDQSVVTSSGNSVTINAPTGTVGTFVYSLVSVQDASATTCLNTATGTATVSVIQVPSAAITGTTSICQHTTTPVVTFTGTNGTAPYTFTYKLNGGADQTITTTSGNAVTLSAPTGVAGTFVYSLVSVRDNGAATCSNAASGSATITVNNAITASISGTVAVCQNAAAPSLTFTGNNGTAPYTFTYKLNGGTDQTITTTSGNTVTLPVATGTAGTNIFTLISVKDIGSSTCNTITSGTSTVTINPLPSATITGSATVCQNATTPLITFTGSSGTAPYVFTYTINGGANQTITTTSGNTVTVAAPTGTAGSFVYNLVSVRDGSATTCNNTATGSATITVITSPGATITGTTALCQNAIPPTVVFTASTTAAPYTFTYRINNGAIRSVTTASGNSVSVTVPTDTAGIYNYSLLTVRDGSAASCVSNVTGNSAVTVNPLPAATMSGVTAVCQNAAAPSLTFTGSNASAPYTFTYTVNGGSPQTVTSTGNTATIKALTGTPGNFTYALVSVRDGSPTACSSAITSGIVVTVNPLPAGTVQSPASFVCEGLTTTLTASGGNTYQWYRDQQVIIGATAASYATTAGGNYMAQLISSAGCVANTSNSIDLALYTRPVLAFVPDKRCLSYPVNFINQSSFASSGPIAWQWNFGDGSTAAQQSPSHSYVAEGMYTIDVTANNLSCPNLTEKFSNSFFIESAVPGIQYPSVTTVVNQPVQLNARNFGARYQWQPSAKLNNSLLASPMATTGIEQLFTVQITSAGGCITMDTILVKVFGASEIYLPQGFTPNGDGQNDRLFPVLVQMQKLNYFKVFNRWGNLVFQTNDASPSNGWDGKYNGKDQPAGTYAWIAEAVDTAGNLVKRSGNILLLK